MDERNLTPVADFRRLGEAFRTALEMALILIAIGVATWFFH